MKVPFSLQRTHFIVFAIFAVTWIVIARFLLPWEVIPYRFEEFLFFRGYIWEPFLAALPLFGAGVALNLYKMVTTVNPPEVQDNARDIPVAGFLTSLHAGVLEELTFRWTMLYGLMGIIWVTSALLSVTIGFSLELFVHEYLWWLDLFFIGNTGTAAIVLQGAWTAGLAALLSNWKFQRGHLYQGFWGSIFSFIAGIFFFRIMFQYGLLAAMLVHFSFDMLIFLMLYADVYVEKKLGLTQAKSRIYQFYP